MGEKTFIKTIISKSPEEGFRLLCNEANEEHGHRQGYSGNINNTDLRGSCVKTYDKPSEKNEEEAMKLVDKTLEYTFKGICRYINLGLEKIYISTAVFEKADNSSKPHYKEVYTFYTMTSEGRTRLSDTRDTLKEAKEFAIKYALKYGEHIWMKKEKIMDKGNGEVGTIKSTRKEIKTEPKSLKPNQRIIKYYKYVFFGCAPE